MLRLRARDIVKKGIMILLTVVLIVSILPVMPEKVMADDFEVSIAGFPESYKPYLRTLHTKYPQWTFKPYNTGIDFSTAVLSEASDNKSLVQKIYNDSLKSRAAGDYDATKGTYIAKDGTSWVSASRNTVAYFMDPRNFLNETHISMFEQLSYDATVHTQQGVEAILNGSFMYNTNIGYLNTAGAYIATNESYSSKIMAAAAESQVSPYYISSKILQEVGKNANSKYLGMGAGSSVNGEYPGYKGYYNFYNIGAYDGSNAVASGLKWASTGNAYNRPWNEPGKSIIGGAKYIGEMYINLGQNTTYFQRFNVVPNTGYNLYEHQYMTSIYGCAGEAATTSTAYATLGIEKRSFTIPVYTNMPEKTTTITIGNATKTGKIVNSNVNMRKAPNTSSDKLTTLAVGDAVTIVSGVMTDISYSTKWLSNPYWYRVKITKDGVAYDGYVSADYVEADVELNVIKGVPTQLSTKLSKTEKVYYEVGNPYIATVDDLGNITGLNQGTTEIKAYTQGGNYSVCNVTVIDKGAVITEKDITLDVGASKKLGVTVYPTNSTDKRVTWTSSNTKVATVAADGTVKAIAAGNAVITAKAAIGGVEGKCNVKVIIPTTGVKLNKKSAKVAVGGKITLKATVSPQNASIKTVKWKSSDKKIAKVKKGVVTGVAAGKVTITATTKNGNKKASCTVTVKPAKMVIAKAKSNGYQATKITWAAVPNVTGYRIYKMNSKGKYKLKASVPAGTNYYVDSKLSTGSVYSYKIAAYRTVGIKNYVGAKSDAKSVKVVPAKTTIKSATLRGTAAIKLKWKKVKGVSGYVVYRRAGTTEKFKKIKTIKKSSTLSYKNKKLQKGVTYYYKIRTYRTVNGKKVYGAYSKTVAVTR